MLSDVEGGVIRRYGVMKPEGSGARRSIFVLDKEGRVVHANMSYNVSEPKHYAEVLQALRGA